MKKKSIYIFLMLLLTVALVGCQNSNNEAVAEDNATIDTTKQVTNVAQLKTDQSVMVFSTVSSVAVLSDEVVEVTPEQVIPEETLPPVEQEEIPSIDMDKANSYLLMMENLLTDNGPIIMSESQSNREDYDYMMIISVKDLAGNVSTYTLYYSIIVEEESPSTPTDTPEENESKDDIDVPSLRRYYRYGEDEKTDNKHSHNDDYRNHDEETHDGYYDKGNKHNQAEDNFKNHQYGSHHENDEIEYKIKALAIIDELEYEVIGKKEIEEDEVEIEFIIKLDENNYVKIEQEVEEDEFEYKYTIYKDGRKYSSLKFESENENNVIHVKLTSEENGFKETYKFIKEADKTIILYQTKGYSYTLVVTSSENAENGEVVYNYYVKEHDYTYKYCKGHHNHH